MTTDPIGDLLTRIRNGITRKKESIVVPSSKMLESITEILKQEKFIEDYKVIKNDVQDELELVLRYVDGTPAIRDLKRVSKPGVRKYRGYREIKPVKNGLGVGIFSTPMGVITDKDARTQKVGGEYLCEIY